MYDTIVRHSSTDSTTRADIERRRNDQTAPGRAVDLIVAHVRAGRYVPGQRLIESDLVEDLGVSRSTVREALRRLDAQGLIEMVPHRGARIRSLTIEEVQEIYGARVAIESEAARLAARNIDRPGNRQRIREAIQDLRKASSEGIPVYLGQLVQFHQTILELGGNRRLTEIIEQLRLQTMRFAFSSDRMVRAYRNSVTKLEVDSLSQHERIAERILAGDAEGAANAMRIELETVIVVVTDVLTGLNEP